jgi:hypothetical protein
MSEIEYSFTPFGKFIILTTLVLALLSGFQAGRVYERHQHESLKRSK